MRHLSEQGEPSPDGLIIPELTAVLEAFGLELELSPLATRIVEETQRLFGAQVVALGLAGETGLRVAAVSPAGRIEAWPPSVEWKEVGWQDAEVVRADVDGVGALAVAPLTSAGVKLGALLVGMADAEQARTALPVCALLGRYAGQAIANARRYERERRRVARQRIVQQVSRLISSSGLSVDEVLQRTVAATTQHLDLASAGIFLADADEPEMLELRAAGGIHGPPPVAGYRQHIDVGVIGAAARERRPILIPDVRREPRYLAIAGMDEVRSELALPIICGDTFLGVLNIESNAPLETEAVDDLQLVADQLAIAIDHAYLFDRTGRALDETLLLYDTSRRISVALDMFDVVRAYLDQVATGGRYACTIALYEFDGEGKRSEVVVCGRWTPASGVECPLNERVPHVQDALDVPLDAGQAVCIADVRTDARVSAQLREMQEEDQRPALALIPLMVQGRRTGLVILSYGAVHEWPEANLRLYEITATLLASAIDSRLQNSLITERNRQLAIWEERRRLARELHDSVTQLMFSMTLIAQSIEPAWRRSVEEGRLRVQRLLELSQDALGEMRALLRELRPAEGGGGERKGFLPSGALASLLHVQEQGLGAALRSLVEQTAADGLEAVLEGEETTSGLRLSQEFEVALFRIAQEGLHNVVKHARAGRVVVGLAGVEEGGGRALVLRVRDDGVGFAVGEESSSPGGMGLQTIRERAEALGGTLAVTSAPGVGTVVEARLPVRPEIGHG